MPKRKRPSILFKTETSYGTEPTPSVEVSLLRKPFVLPIDDSPPRMLMLEGRIALTSNGIREGAAFLRKAADQLEGMSPRPARKRKT